MESKGQFFGNLRIAMKLQTTPIVGLCVAFATIALALLSAPCRANDLNISAVSLIDAGGGKADIQFTMSWKNSWHESWTETGGSINVTNWDAAWVFAKYRQNGGLWKHVVLTGAGHTPTGGTAIDVPDDGGGTRLGVFVHRSATGTGTVTCTNMRLRWDLAAAGIPSPDDIDVTVLAVEMVYIPEGAFYLGSGGTEGAHFYAAPDVTTPFLVTGEAEITIGSDPGNLSATGAIFTGSIPEEYPKGFAAFYCMKYEVTEGQYVDFLNLLDPAIAGDHFPNAAGSQRHTIAATAGGGFETSAPDRACGFFNWVRFPAYLDWCGLRPMTELEFEKACRGPKQPWINEYAWGNADYTALTGFTGTDGSGTETALPAGANAHLANTVYGPVRAGIFATGTATRLSAGASYFGVMELSGNILEFAVSAARDSGRVFIGLHGDGNEYTSPFPLWPTDLWAYGGRGGHLATGGTLSRVSDRSAIDSYPYRYVEGLHGGRGVRSAP